MTKSKRTWKAGLLGLAALLLGGVSWASDPVSSNNSATFQVRITPNVDLGVTVNTSGAAWSGDADLYGDLDLGATRLMGTGVTVTMAGNFQRQELSLAGTNIDTWVLDTDESTTENALRLYAMIGANQTTDVPLAADVSGSGNILAGGATRAGQSVTNEGGDSSHTYEFSTGAGTKYANVDDMAVSTARRLWLRADTPATTTTDGQQKFTITVTAVTGTAL